jgi:hypothetical protein
LNAHLFIQCQKRRKRKLREHEHHDADGTVRDRANDYSVPAEFATGVSDRFDHVDHQAFHSSSITRDTLG